MLICCVWCTCMVWPFLEIPLSGVIVLTLLKSDASDLSRYTSLDRSERDMTCNTSVRRSNSP